MDMEAARREIAIQLDDLMKRLEDAGDNDARHLLWSVAMGHEDSLDIACPLEKVHGLATMLWTCATTMFVRREDELAVYYRELADRMDQEAEERRDRGDTLDRHHHTPPSMN